MFSHSFVFELNWLSTRDGVRKLYSRDRKFNFFIKLSTLYFFFFEVLRNAIFIFKNTIIQIAKKYSKKE